MKNKLIFLFSILLLIPFIHAESEQQIMSNNVSVSIVGFGDINNSKMNISFKPYGSPGISYTNLPMNTIINEIKNVLFIADIDSNKSINVEMLTNCNNFFNESCDGFPCQTSYFVCKDELNDTNNKLFQYESNHSTLGNVTNKLVSCIQTKSNLQTEKNTCDSEKVKLEEELEGKVDWFWILACIVVSVFLCYLGWGKKKVSTPEILKKVGNKFQGDEKEMKPKD